jgi:hypothetical protein
MFTDTVCIVSALSFYIYKIFTFTNKFLFYSYMNYFLSIGISFQKKIERCIVLKRKLDETRNPFKICNVPTLS